MAAAITHGSILIPACWNAQEGMRRWLQAADSTNGHWPLLSWDESRKDEVWVTIHVCVNVSEQLHHSKELRGKQSKATWLDVPLDTPMDPSSWIPKSHLQAMPCV